MDIQRAYITSLKEFYSADQIRAFWKQAFEAQLSRATNLVIITTTGFQGSTSGGIVLSNPDEIATFITACQTTINEISGVTTTDPSNLGTGLSFGSRMLQV